MNRENTAEAEPGPPALSRGGRIIAAITEAIITAQRDDEDPSVAWVDTDAALSALAVVAARIAFQTKTAVTAADCREFAEGHAEMIDLTLKALRKSGDKFPFARMRRPRSVAMGGKGRMLQFSVAVDPHERI